MNWKKVKSYFKKLKKKINKFFKKVKKFFKIYFKQVKIYADDGDYRPVAFTAGGLIIIILLLWLLISWIIPDKKSSTDSNSTLTADAIISNGEIATETDSPETALLQNDYINLADTIIACKSNYDRKNYAKQLYEENKDLLVLVNNQTPIPENYSFEHTTMNNGMELDSRAYEPLKQMLTDLNAADLHYTIISAYRSRESQQQIIDDDVKSYMAQGLTEDEALQKTYSFVQKPGCSEHETGLCLDISPEGVYMLDQELESNPVEVWLMQHCYDYGFILRYPKEKANITGIESEPWHYRYVGIPVATFLRDNNLTLEEYIQLVNE